ncbi:S16 family serine protease [Microbacterium sp. C7(2022)]|uniref:YlbL family protein n=1 Tax=Microbacterium sp. C7(2022) TaxID=2992759 RepID=UPI00237A32E2|nr:S16 family serine protease [Microbacterium sp. C7(2022)]MDE0545683.1 PDZ domain-containing protein [Microbacterium sp. C7(2022)]
MTLFHEEDVAVPVPRRRLPRATVAGIWALAVALVVLLVLTFLPTAYVIQRPGPVYNTLGSATAADGEEVPLISIEGADTYATEGALDLLTVQVVGNRERTPSWVELALAWTDPRKAVLPLDSVFPEGTTTEERNEESAAMMVDSQQEATAAALTELGYDVGAQLTVHSVIEDSAAEGVVMAGDVIVAADGVDVADAAAVREVVNAADGDAVELSIIRDGADETVSITPRETEVDGETMLLLGVTLSTVYDFPIDVTIQLNNVGGPSAGMMFALGIMDELTEASLNGGETVAGTGTITASGDVGPIGGIRQKLWGAKDAGATAFLAPIENCDEVVGHVPPGMDVFAVDTLDDALEALDVVSTGGAGADELPTCTAD